MEIGNDRKTYTIEPLDVPREKPVVEPQPVKEPVKTPEPVPA